MTTTAIHADLLSPADASAALGISVSTITRCVKLGAPVHRWGSTGYRYRIKVDEFVRWMEAQGGKQKPSDELPTWDVDEMAARRRRLIKAL